MAARAWHTAPGVVSFSGPSDILYTRTVTVIHTAEGDAFASPPRIYIKIFYKPNQRHARKRTFPSLSPLAYHSHQLLTLTHRSMSPVAPYLESPFQPRVLIEDFADTKEYGLPRVA